MDEFKGLVKIKTKKNSLTFTKSAAEAARDAAPEEIVDHPQLAVAAIDYVILKHIKSTFYGG